MMAVNLRGRLAKHVPADLERHSPTEAHAGNYEHTIVYRQPDHKTPGSIRRSVQQMKRAGAAPSAAAPTRMPTTWEYLTGGTAVITNWAGFAQDVALPGCKQLYHQPLLSQGPSVSNYSMCIIFRPRKGELRLVLTKDAETHTSKGNGMVHNMQGMTRS